MPRRRRAEWQLDPWSAEIRDDEKIWGRGALDMKGQVAAAAVALASLAREGFRPNGDLLFVAAADEEVGVDVGLQWLAREHPETVRAEYALNEGGGDRVVFGGRAVLPLLRGGEDEAAPFGLRVRGRSGHASMPGIADNALLKAARLVDPARRPPSGAGPHARDRGPLRRPFRRHAAGRGRGTRSRGRGGDRSAGTGASVEPLLSLTLAPTMIEASSKRNVIPAAVRG